MPVVNRSRMTLETSGHLLREVVALGLALREHLKKFDEPLVAELIQKVKDGQVDFMASNLNRAIHTLAIATQDLMAMEEYNKSPFVMSDLQETSNGKDASCNRAKDTLPPHHDDVEATIPEFDMSYDKGNTRMRK